MAAINKNFVIKNGLEVDTNLIFADPQTNKVGIGTTVPQYTLHVNGGIGVTDLYVSGIATIATLNATGIAVTDFTVFNNLSVGGISTFTNGPVLIGSGTSTGTASQTLQVTGGTYVSGNLGIGSTNPTSALFVVGDARVTGVITATTFSGNVNVGVGTITTLGSTSGTITNLTGTAGTITTFNSTNGTITNLTGTAGTITTFNSTNGTITNLNVTGISTLGTVRISSGIITATSGVVTYFGDGSYLTGLAGNPTLQQVLNTGNTSTIGMSISGVSTLTTLNVGSGVTINASGINVTGVITATSFVGNGANLTGIANTANIVSTAITTGTLNVTTFAVIGSGVTINSSGINVTGVVTATSFVGDGSGLTGAGSTVFIDTTTNQEFFPLFTATTSGTITASGISTSKLTYNPSTGAMTAVDFNSTSDINLKENIHTVGNALEITEQLRGVSFDWKETGRSSYGVIAQELEEVLPELVKKGEVKSVNYNGIIGVLIEAIKELKKEVERLKVAK